jgi:membrane-bound ClpP family serine protease
MLVPLAREQGYPPLLFEAALDRDLEIYRVKSKTDPGDERLLSARDLQIDAKSANPRWLSLGLFAKSGPFLKITAPIAKEWRVARYADVDSVEALYGLYALEAAKVRVAPDSWLDKVAEFFREPWVNFFLIMVGIVGLILELKMPGTGFPGVIAAVCFVLFFWAYSFVGEFTLLAVLLFVLGLILLGVEVLVLPGFGITGISGILLVVASLVVVTMEKMPETTQDWVNLGATLTTFGVSLVAAIAAAVTIAWYLPSIPYASRLVLAPPKEEEEAREVLSHSSAGGAALLGAIGVAMTSLRPAGKAQFGDDFLDVIAEGDFVNPGSRVQVIEIEGNRIVVKEI